MENPFPVCTLHEIPQRSPEWDAIRADKLTASTAGTWISKEKLTKAQETARESAIDTLIAARLGAPIENSFEIDMDDDPPKSPALRAIYYGILYEAEALMALSFDQDFDLQEVGFCEHESGIAGSSPDSLVKGERGVVENKVTMIHRLQVGRLRKGTLPDEYRNQCHFQMATTGADYCWFQSWHPTLPPLQIKVERDEFTDQIEAGIYRFKDDFDKAWDDWANTHQ